MKRSPSTAKFFSKLNKMLKLNWTCFGLSLGTLGLLNAMSLSASADVVGNESIKFNEDTIVEFEFIESHGAYQSTFGIVDLDSCQTNSSGTVNFDSCIKTPLLSEVKASDSFDTVYRRSTYETDLQDARSNDFLGTPGNTVPDFKREFLFKANKRYAFYLESKFDGKPTGTVYTTNLMNYSGNQQALFNEEGLLTTEAVAKRRNNLAYDTNKFDSLIDGGLLINFDDTGSALVRSDLEDADFDDFVVGMGGGIICEEPQTSKTEPQP